MIHNNSTTLTIFLVIITFIFLGCLNQEGNQKKKRIPQNIRSLSHLTVYPKPGQIDTVRLKKVQSFEKHYWRLPLRTAPIAVDDLNRVFILNKPKLAIDVYDKHGNLVTRLGRKGRGPGEFHEINWMQILGSCLYVYDGRLERIQVFLLHSLSYETTVQTIPKNLGRFSDLRYTDHDPVFIISDTTILHRFDNMSKVLKGSKLNTSTTIASADINYFIMNKNQRLLPDTVLHQKGREMAHTTVSGMSVTLPFSFIGKSLMAISENHRIYTAWTHDFLIKVYNMKGKYLRAFYYPYNGAPLTKFGIDRIFKDQNFIIKQAMQKVINDTKMPATWPALHSMKIDDQNQLWVSTIVENQKVYQWWVLNKKGKLLARFHWPRSKPIVAIRNEYLYAVKTNHKKGTYRVVKYKIHFSDQ